MQSMTRTSQQVRQGVLEFSGTGNSRYAVEHFVKTYDKAAMVYSIEDSDATHHIEAAGRIVFGYPVQYSNYDIRKTSL